MSSQNKNEGKPRLGLVLKDFSHAIEALARLRENNLKKYARDNWAESIGTPDAQRFLEENLESIQRHVSSMWKGEELDAENGDHHATAIMCRVCFILEYYYRQKDDIRVTFASPVKGITSYSDSEVALVAKLEVETAPNSGEYESWDKIIADKIDALYQWPSDPQYVYAAFASYGEIFYSTNEPKIEGEKISYVGGFIDTTNAGVPIELCPHWKVSVRKRPAKKTIYDWTDVPKIYNWLAKDRSEKVFMYATKPSLSGDEWLIDSMNLRNCAQITDEPWWTSLEARPT